VIGAGLWISTILALERLGLDPRQDQITIFPVGSPVQIFRALEQGEIDAALVSTAQSRELQAKGFAVLLKDYPPDISSFGGGLVISSRFLASNRDVVENVVHALLEALALCLGGRNKEKSCKHSTNLSVSPTTKALQTVWPNCDASHIRHWHR
jgi:ABC-type nitrate/sulfonate/bicarbonate transport system substrate-binding protein